MRPAAGELNVLVAASSSLVSLERVADDHSAILANQMVPKLIRSPSAAPQPPAASDHRSDSRAFPCPSSSPFRERREHETPTTSGRDRAKGYRSATPSPMLRAGSSTHLRRIRGPSKSRGESRRSPRPRWPRSWCDHLLPLERLPFGESELGVEGRHSGASRSSDWSRWTPRCAVRLPSCQPAAARRCTRRSSRLPRRRLARRFRGHSPCCREHPPAVPAPTTIVQHSQHGHVRPRVGTLTDDREWQGAGCLNSADLIPCSLFT